MTRRAAGTVHRLSTPRAAASAGLIFAVLFATILLLIRLRMPEGAGDTGQWLATQHRSILAATVLMPFAGISFLWFIGVVRDAFGRYEDRFFATVFLGSGLLFLAMMFVATGVAAGLAAIGSHSGDIAVRTEIIEFGKTVLLSTSKTYALRMAAVFMISLATIWVRTNVMPRWLAVVSYVLALVLLVGAEVSMWLTLAFPVWVFVVSLVLMSRTAATGRRAPGAW
jgi:hypothetical protein